MHNQLYYSHIHYSETYPPHSLCGLGDIWPFLELFQNLGYSSVSLPYLEQLTSSTPFPKIYLNPLFELRITIVQLRRTLVPLLQKRLRDYEYGKAEIHQFLLIHCSNENIQYNYLRKEQLYTSSRVILLICSCE